MDDKYALVRDIESIYFRCQSVDMLSKRVNFTFSPDFSLFADLDKSTQLIGS